MKVYRADGVTLEAVRGVDIELGVGEFVAVMGPSGSGKSTLLHVLGGLEPATSGEIWLRGRRVDGLSTAAWAILRRQHIGFVFQFLTLLPGDNGTFIARAIGTTDRPYPFRAVQGRMFQAPNEAVAGQGFLDLMHIGVGAWISPTIDGVPVILHIVGRTIEPDNNGDVLDFGLDALNHAGSVPPQLVYHLVLKPGVRPAAARARLLAESDDRLDVQVVTTPASGLRGLELVIAVSVVILAVIGLASLLTATVVGMRDHQHEMGVLAAIGLTPRQVVATLVTNTMILTLLGVTTGTVAGLLTAPRLINMQGETSGIGSGIAVSLSAAAIAAILAVALATAATAAVCLARRTTRNSGSAHLHTPAAAAARTRAARPLARPA